MRTIRVFVAEPLSIGVTVALAEQAAGHVSRVLRLKEGDALQLFNGDGSQYDAVLTQCDKKAVRARVDAATTVNRESPLAITLMQGISRGERMDYTVQKAVELGVSRIEPVISERCGVSVDADRWEKKREHWQRVAESACEQSGRNVVPQIATVRRLDIALSELAAGNLRLMLDPEGQHNLRDLPLQTAVVLLAGPEGGLGEMDMKYARAAKFSGLRLGPRILRTETAAMAALAGLQVLAGDFC
ncbi:16S rRNA (uracil(1498)-N(3))-methyltransferase [Permianibacter sp. IMCC34836]|uniref:16S rRNA (uracil(1498)-N(3))-methyltransferase n=1 Tax=Permianibacter fluminis TaxID=2738515 RepID=UPI0015567D09|nr:16S rRNA (uracil(1498)-N(3))-methyltransferase [Permianibacter fluminis]NQD35794.1 16S rRNA (uracil(1498)-N(3))-methyltransferase [Permianibacter fluminis]